MDAKYEQRKKMIYDFMCDDMYVPMKIKELAIVLGVKKDQRPQLEQILNELMTEGRIVCSKRGKFSKSEEKKITGTFQAHPKGFGFVSVEGEKEDIFIPESETNGAMHMDTVEISVSPAVTGRRREGKVLHVLERGMKQVVCTYQLNKNFGFAVPDNPKFGSDIFIPLERSKGAVNGHKVVVEITSIDANIQSIVEEKIKDWNEKYRDNYYKGTGSINTAAIVMNPNNGEILAMADYPNVDLNNPRDLSKWYTKKQIKNMSEDEKMDALNEIWQNFCVSSTYEPGSVQKPFTVACGLETGTIKDKMTFDCDGYEDFNGQKVRCVARYGHGIETVRKTLMDSCNDAIMQMSYKIGKNHFTEYQSIYGFGQKTGIDLPGEANTASLMYQVEDMKPIDLATNAFGQNYNCTMVQMVSGFASLINGGTYYQPHLVTKITDSTGNTISTVEPKAVKQTISQSTSDKIRDYLQSVVKEGTGNTAKVDGYSMGGKTGTAQKFPRGNGKYLVSFMGFAPYDNPQVLIYVVVNEPNVADQPHSVFAQNIAREILEEVLPYMNIYPDEKKTGVNKGYDVTGSKDSSQYTGKHNGTKSRNEKKKKN